MNDVQAKSNICKIFHRQDDGTEVVFGCGCLVKCGETLKIATSSKIRNLTGGEVFAKFQGGEIKLQVDNTDEHEEHLGSEDGKIAYVSFDDTAFKQNSDAGFYKEDNLEELEEMPCRVPVVDNFEKFGKRNEFNPEFCEVVKEQGKASLKLQQGSNTRVLKDKHDVDPKNLMVLGCPILSQQNKFLGIVDFLDVDNESLFDLIYLGTQRNRTAKQSPICQETDSGSREKLSPDDPLAELWNKSIDFRNEFSKVLDVKYKEIQYWPHLAEKYGIERKIYDAFSTSDIITSPTETMLEYLAAKQPALKIEEFCKSLEASEASEVCDDVVKKNCKEYNKDGVLSMKDKVTKICDKAPRVLDDIILKLDREKRLWKNLARERKIPEEIYSTFERDRSENPTRVFFEVLRTRNPYLKVKNFKDSVTRSELYNIIEVLNDFKISDDMLLKDLSKHPDAKIKIENILNNLETDFLWKLADHYQKEGLMEGIDIEKAFRNEEDIHSPTKMMMEYVIASKADKNHTIKDLIIKLVKMKREDCFQCIEPYLKGGVEDIDKIKRDMKTNQGGASGERRQVSSTNEESNGVAATEQSETTNQYVNFNLR